MKPINFQTAEMIVKNLRAPGLRSDSMLASRYNALYYKGKVDLTFSKTMNKVIVERIRKNLYEFSERPFDNYSDYLKALKDWFKKTKIANCGELADLTKMELSSRGIKSKIIDLDIKSTISNEIIPFTDHSFVVINLDNNAQIERPHTWGKNAVIADAWAGFVKRAQDGLTFLKYEIYKLSNNQEMIFKLHGSK